MKRLLPFFVLLAALAMMACSKDKHVAVSDIISSDCLTHPMKDVFFPADSIITHYADGTLYVEHQNLMVCCGFEKVEVRLAFAHDTINIVEAEIHDGPVPNCICLIHNSFQIHNLTSGHHVLVFERCSSGPQLVDIDIE